MTKISPRQPDGRDKREVVITRITDPEEIARLDAILKPFSQNGQWFTDNFEELKVKYRGRWVVIVDQQVAGFGKDRRRLQQRLQKRGVNLTSSYWKYIPERDIILILSKAA